MLDLKSDTTVNGNRFTRGVRDHQRIDIELGNVREVAYQLRETQKRFFDLVDLRCGLPRAPSRSA